MRRRLMLGGLLLVGGAALGIAVLATLVVVALSAGGVLTTPPGAWVVPVRPLPGMRATLSVPGLVRFATSPMVLWLLDGRSFATRFGTLRLARDADALRVVCAPCRLALAQLAAQPIQIERLQLRLAQAGGQSLAGELSGDGVAVHFTARLAPQHIDIDWQLPSSEIAAVYRLLGSVIPEAHLAHVEGRAEAHGSLRLPQRHARVALEIDGFRVDGLGTEKLAEGPIAFGCPSDEGTPVLRRVTPGEGRWISPAGSGALLAAAVLAAEDQRFHQHQGFDRAEIAQVLAAIDGQAPARGASTITQQLARALFTGTERTGARKLRELLYAVELERTLDKGRILALYLNTVHWGPGICGADAAARTYFGKRPQQLNPLEAAWLAGILPNPQRAFADAWLSGAPDTARAVRVLEQMHSLPRRERQRWAGRSLVLALPPAPDGAAQLADLH